jgi:hypothetical protein
MSQVETRGRGAVVAVLSASLIVALVPAFAGSASADPQEPPSAQISKKKRKPPRLECPSHGSGNPRNVNLYEEVSKVVDVIAAQVVARGFTINPNFGKYTGATCVKLGPNSRQGHGQVHAHKFFPESANPAEFGWRFYMTVTLTKKGKVKIVLTEMQCEAPVHGDPPMPFPGCFNPTYP